MAVVDLDAVQADDTVGMIGEAGTQGVGRQRALLAPTMLILIFTEALALYGLVVGMIASQGGVRKLDA